MVILAWLRRAFALLLPGIVAIVAILAASKHLAELRHSPLWLQSLPLILLTAAILLGVLFRQTRIVLPGVLLTAVTLQCAPDAPLVTTAILRAAILLPIWFAACHHLPEQRLFSSWGLALLAMAATLSGSLFLPATPAIDDRLTALVNIMASDRWGALSSVPLPALVLTAGAAMVLLIGRKFLIGALLLQALILALIALDARVHDWADIFFCTAMSGSAALFLCAVLTGIWQQTFIDELTGLPGRRALTQHMASLGRRQALAVVDVDHFKKVNDRHGHDVGDQVLRFLAARLRAFRYGTAYRFGGEEFVIVLKRANAKDQFARLDALRKGIADKRFVLRSLERPRKRPHGKDREKPAAANRTIKVTVSIGMAVRSDKNRKPEEILQAADKALYRAKRGGRNRVK
jgi:diguanylate cyclase (GGDEF)-like protein